jgi:hypothetical protein
MTQRKIERVAGWAAFVSWCAFAALFAFVFYLAAAAPDSVQPQHVASKRQAKRGSGRCWSCSRPI